MKKLFENIDNDNSEYFDNFSDRLLNNAINLIKQFSAYNKDGKCDIKNISYKFNGSTLSFIDDNIERELPITFSSNCIKNINELFSILSRLGIKKLSNYIGMIYEEYNVCCRNDIDFHGIIINDITLYNINIKNLIFDNDNNYTGAYFYNCDFKDETASLYIRNNACLQITECFMKDFSFIKYISEQAVLTINFLDPESYPDSGSFEGLPKGSYNTYVSFAEAEENIYMPFKMKLKGLPEKTYVNLSFFMSSSAKYRDIFIFDKISCEGLTENHNINYEISNIPDNVKKISFGGKETKYFNDKLDNVFIRHMNETGNFNISLIKYETI